MINLIPTTPGQFFSYISFLYSAYNLPCLSIYFVHISTKIGGNLKPTWTNFAVPRPPHSLHPRKVGWNNTHKKRGKHMHLLPTFLSVFVHILGLCITVIWRLGEQTSYRLHKKIGARHSLSLSRWWFHHGESSRAYSTFSLLDSLCHKWRFPSCRPE